MLVRCVYLVGKSQVPSYLSSVCLVWSVLVKTHVVNFECAWNNPINLRGFVQKWPEKTCVTSLPHSLDTWNQDKLGLEWWEEKSVEEKKEQLMIQSTRPCVKHGGGSWQLLKLTHWCLIFMWPVTELQEWILRCIGLESQLTFSQKSALQKNFDYFIPNPVWWCIEVTKSWACFLHRW